MASFDGYEGCGAKAEFENLSVKLKSQEAKLKDFCYKTDRKVDKFRVQVNGFDKSVSQKAVWAEKKAVAKVNESGIIRVRQKNYKISSSIEKRNTGKGNPNAILTFGIDLNNRQKRLLEKLPEFDSKVIVPKKSVSMSDLSALTAKTGDEFAMFTKGGNRLIIRGNKISVNVNIEIACPLAKEGYRWSGHTHPGYDILCMFNSEGDKAVFEQFYHKSSVIYNSKGQYYVFRKE